MIQFAWKFQQVTCLELQLTEKLHTFLDTLANNWLVTEAGSTFKPPDIWLHDLW